MLVVQTISVGSHDSCSDSSLSLSLYHTVVVKVLEIPGVMTLEMTGGMGMSPVMLRFFLSDCRCGDGEQTCAW